MPYKLDCAIWETTLACNLRCSHCGSAAGRARTDELTTEEALRLCEQLAGIGCSNVALMGGEVFLREDWLEIARCITDLGMKLSFVSNGFVLERHIDDLVDLDPIVVGISIDGLRKTHDMIRGVKGSLKRAIHSINLLRRKRKQVTVITTVSKLNLKELPRMKDIFLNKGINWQIQLATPFGNFKSEQMLSYEEFYSVGLFIAAQHAKFSFQNMPVVGAHCMGYHSSIMPGSAWQGCTAGRSSIGITSNGGIVGCLAMGNDRYIEGNIREESLHSIWYGDTSFSYNRNFKPTDLGNHCQDCKYGSSCQGGCNSVSLGTTGTLHNNPFCFHRIERDVITT